MGKYVVAKGDLDWEREKRKEGRGGGGGGEEGRY